MERWECELEAGRDFSRHPAQTNDLPGANIQMMAESDGELNGGRQALMVVVRIQLNYFREVRLTLLWDRSNTTLKVWVRF